MRTILLSLVLSLCLMMPCAHGADMTDLLKSIPLPSLTGAAQDSGTVASGLKEALSVGTKNAVGLLSKRDGYFGNEAVKILLPENIRKVGDALRMAGYEKEVDAFVLSMNRATEKAAPKAADIFAGAIQSMSIEDAQKILNGGDGVLQIENLDAALRRFQARHLTKHERRRRHKGVQGYDGPVYQDGALREDGIP